MSKKRIDLRKRKAQPKNQPNAMRPNDRCPVCQDRLYSYDGGKYCGKCGWSMETDGRNEA